MADSTPNNCIGQVQTQRETLDEVEGLPFCVLLSWERVQAELTKFGVKYRDRIYTPIVTIWAFLSQVLSKDGSCEVAVGRVLAHRVESGQKPCSENTGSYCVARQKLPEGVLSGLARGIGRETHDQTEDHWKWKGRDVQIVDGSTCAMADTPENQAEYPQSRSQKAGLGFPILRFVTLFSLAAGTVLECAIGSCRGKKTGELSQFRTLQATLQSGTILLGDRYYDSYQDIANLRQRGVDVVFGMKNLRNHDFRTGRKLGQDDHVVVWKRPKYNKSRFNSKEEWESLPESMEMRECRIIIKRKGFKTRVIIVVTTLLDGEIYSKSDLMELFSQRWYCELYLRSVKSSLGMNLLKCKTPEMVRKEFWTYMLAYNVIRARIAQAGRAHNQLPQKLSFQSAKTFILAFLPAQERASGETAECLAAELDKAISRGRVGNRPGRKEPRARKKRDSKYPSLTKPRVQARQGLPA